MYQNLSYDVIYGLLQLILTRIHNAISAVSYMRRMVNLARSYATEREAFGKLIIEHPLHARTLSLMEMQVQGSLVFLMEVSRLLGLEECGMATDDQKALLRILTPLLKLFTAKEVRMQKTKNAFLEL